MGKMKMTSKKMEKNEDRLKQEIENEDDLKKNGKK